MEYNKERIDQDFLPIRVALVAFEGREARDRLQVHRDEDKGLFNALYWRVDNWMTDYLLRQPFTDKEVELKLSREDVGTARRMRFLCALGKFPWQTDDLPYLMQELKKGA